MIGLLDWWDLVWTIGESQQWLQAENDITPLFFVFVLMFLIEVVGGYVLWMMDVRCNLDHHGEVRHLHTMYQRSSMQLLSAVRHLTEGRTVKNDNSMNGNALSSGSRTRRALGPLL